jgi:hypothetical protein
VNPALSVDIPFVRLDLAFARLKALGLYPEEIASGSEADCVLRALAQYEASRGNFERTLKIYREVLGKVLASHPTPETSLEDALELSQLHEALGETYRRAGRNDLATTQDVARLNLWRLREKKLPKTHSFSAN